MNLLEQFRKAISIETCWPASAPTGDEAAEAPLRVFQDFLRESYPCFHRTAERWVLSPYQLVYRWPGGAVNGGDRNAVLILAHYDVVPAEKEKWSADPFSAEIRDPQNGGNSTEDKYIYGRGTLDMKNMLIGIMEAAEGLCEKGFKPGRDIWFAFGGDEERAGIHGAMETAKWFTLQGRKFDWVLDEGSPVVENQIKGVTTPLALFSIEEKGFLSLELTAVQKPGHASRPPRVQAAAILAKALVRISKKPFPFRLTPVAESFFTHLAPYAPPVQAFFMKRAKLLGLLFFKAVSGSPDIASMLQTTVAMTQLEGSAADNVLPSEVRAVLNLRLLPPWTVKTAMARIKAVINDKRVEVRIFGLGTEPVPANPEHAKLGGPGWAEMESAVKAVFPGIPLLPFLMTATTDSRHFQHLAGGIFRFNPVQLTAKELALIHGHDERISIANLQKGAAFYTNLFGSL
jgi:carboxypeptidase PM20D1